MKSLSGYVESITFRNEENGYTVLTLSYGKKEIKCTGNFGYISEGEYLEIEGEEVFHDIYGEQIKVTSYKVIPATDELSLKKYLGSGAIKGLGAVLANRIVDKFGEDTLRIVEEEPERLAEIRGITIRKAMDICEQVEEKKDMRDVMIFLQGYGISPTLSNKIYTMYGQKVYDIIKTNPYKLADDLSGIGFKTADEIARRAGVEVNASIRIKSGMCYALSDASVSGHTYLPKEKLVEKTINLLGLRDQYLNADGTYNMDLLDNCFTELVLEKKLILKNIEEKDRLKIAGLYSFGFNAEGKILCSQEAPDNIGNGIITDIYEYDNAFSYYVYHVKYIPNQYTTIISISYFYPYHEMNIFQGINSYKDWSVYLYEYDKERISKVHRYASRWDNMPAEEYNFAYENNLLCAIVGEKRLKNGELYIHWKNKKVYNKER